MTDETVQQTLNGTEAECGRTRPHTLLYCYKCGTRILRSRVRTHADDHAIPPRPRWENRFFEPTEETRV